MSSLNLNKVVLCGRLTADPELKQTQSGVPVVSFTLAINRRYQGRNNDVASNQPTADFINIVCWRKTAEFVTKYFNKGKPILVRGSLQTRTWTDNNDVKHYETEVVADGYFHESEFRSAPYFDAQIDGIILLNKDN